MGSTKLQKRGINLNRLTDKQRKFVLEYLVCLNAKQAAINAGYSSKSAAGKGAALLKQPAIASAVGKLQKKDVDKLELDRNETLKQLYYALTRRVSDFVDEDGELLQPHELPEQVQSIVDGFEQVTLTDKFGQVTGKKMKYKLTPHAIAREQAMKHKGLFEEDNHQKADKVNFNFDVLIGREDKEYDPIQNKIINIEKD